MANAQKFEIWKSDKNEKWYWHFVAGNGEVVAGGEGYAKKQGAIHACDLLKGSSGATVYYLNSADKDKD